MNHILLGESIRQAILMFLYSSLKIISDTNVEGPISLTGQDVYIVIHIILDPSLRWDDNCGPGVTKSLAPEGHYQVQVVFVVATAQNAWFQFAVETKLNGLAGESVKPVN